MPLNAIPHNQPDSPARKPATSRNTGNCCPLQSRRGLWIWGVLLLFLLYTQWTTIKGMYYRVTDPPAPSGTIHWQSDFNAALSEAQKTGRPVLVDLSASWCPPCRVMKHEVWPDDEVGNIVNNNYVPLLLDIDASNARAVAQRYKVSVVPTILILDCNGKLLKQGNAMSKKELLQFIKQAA